MIIVLDGRALSVPAPVEQQIIDQLFELVAEKVYPMISTPAQLLMMHYSRGKLKDIEQANIKAGYDAALVRSLVRPPQGADPNLHYLRIMLADTLRDMEHAMLAVCTEAGTDTIKSIALPIDGQDQAGG